MINLLLSELTYWHWACLGLVLLCIEMVFPGSFFIWIGFASLLTAALTYCFDFMLPAQITSFAIFSIIGVTIGARLYRSLEISKGTSSLNRRADQMIGMTLTLSDPIVNGVGHIVMGDSRWRAIGKDMPAHTQVQIVDVNGNSLIIEEISPRS
ncbi:NfeD family protein [Candidatus Odyssella thessalonicensis]|uniref:NfeD family protein n=1 Tax=Candidatus Odyssella thessalonicensis TaxID=84647 RepID=UPI000225BAEC|nr:NfeD family protein [Candidatus Odyssella thessalonicensis]